MTTCSPSTARPPVMMDAPAKRAGRRSGRVAKFGFVIAGVQKAGTTSLYAMLSEHPQVAPAQKKELRFFDDEDVDWDNPAYGRYNRKIQSRESAIIAGEASPRYIFWPGAMERIREYNPEMLIILAYRDPIERAFSHWGMSASHGWKWDFTETIRRGWDSKWPRPRDEYGASTSKTILARGYYGAQLEHALSIFEQDQLLLLDYHRLFRDLEGSLRRITGFLGVDAFTALPDVGRENTAPQNIVARPPTPENVSALAELYAEDLAKFADVSGLDVSSWPTSRLLAGELSAAELAERLASRVNLTPPPARRKRPKATLAQPETAVEESDPAIDSAAGSSEPEPADAAPELSDPEPELVAPEPTEPELDASPTAAAPPITTPEPTAVPVATSDDVTADGAESASDFARRSKELRARRRQRNRERRERERALSAESEVAERDVDTSSVGAADSAAQPLQ